VPQVRARSLGDNLGPNFFQQASRSGVGRNPGEVWPIALVSPQVFGRTAKRTNNTLCYSSTFAVNRRIVSVEGPVMNISLTPELERLVENKVKSGRYASASEVIREGLRLLEEQEQLKQQRLTEVRRKIDRGLDQLDRGLGIPGPEARARLRQRRSVK
jgi:antitoxin ParD1/3/4